MPNTLAHLAIQIPAGRALGQQTLILVCMGLMIPDLPWILQRVLLYVDGSFSALHIRSYCLALSTPALCLLLSWGISLLFRNPVRTLTVLFSQCLLHFFLDGLEQKGGIGILWFAPLNWASFSFEILSMDGVFVRGLSILGIVLGLILIFRRSNQNKDLFRLNRVRMIGSSALLMIYLLVPLALMDTIIEKDVHHFRSWAMPSTREDNSISFDRAVLVPGCPTYIKNDLTPEPVVLKGFKSEEPGLIIGRGMFASENELILKDYTIIDRNERSVATFVGIVMVMAILARHLLLPAFAQRPKDT